VVAYSPQGAQAVGKPFGRRFRSAIHSQGRPAFAHGQIALIQIVNAAEKNAGLLPSIRWPTKRGIEPPTEAGGRFASASGSVPQDTP
jgi:hypothetical protein